MGAINYLIWLDQLNGILQGISILLKCIEISLPVPLSAFVGAEFCRWVDLPGSFYLTGSYVWSCFTAVYRILCIFNLVGEGMLIKVNLWFLEWQPFHSHVMVFCTSRGIYLGFSQCQLWGRLVFLSPISNYYFFLTSPTLSLAAELFMLNCRAGPFLIQFENMKASFWWLFRT